MTGKHLEAKGFHVELKTAKEVVEVDEGWPRFVFLMCERLEVLDRLRTLEVSGVPHVNSPRAVHNTYRDRMIAVLDEANVPFIPSRVVATGESPEPGALPVWVKRGDVHNTQEGDVVFASTAGEVETALRRLAGRGITRAVLQPHVTGDLIKFYGVGAGGGPHREPPWFRWFYHKDQKLAGHPMDQRALARLVRRAASALGLEVYGGDAIATATGDLVLLDVNAWPSFALYRDEASAAIASYLALRFAGGRR
ncbi:MAG: hypothetical protein DME00_18365 [Candidatus Rokuibacteriota bacterium]|nr:MAG: hypothetical protein DME00_18365 [Candidatus Rokubacteria bacterium]